MLALFSCAISNAQNIIDVLHYGNENLQGTARYQALSGAFGALGGDLSAINVNPAGTAVFNSSQFTISGTNYNHNNDASYRNRTINTNLNSLKINQAGSVLVLKSADSDNSWQKIALAFNYDLATNFNNRFSLAGSTDQGVDTYFLNKAGGIPLINLQTPTGSFVEQNYLNIGLQENGFALQQAYLGYQASLFEPEFDTEQNDVYNSNAGYNNVNQNFTQTSSGYNSKFILNASGQYEDNLYLGASLNFHAVDYIKITQLRERGFEDDSPIQYINFDNLLYTNGGAFSFSLGAITKLNDNIRIGGSYQSPTWYFLTDETSQRINSNLADENIRFINFDIVNVF